MCSPELLPNYFKINFEILQLKMRLYLGVEMLGNMVMLGNRVMQVVYREQIIKVDWMFPKKNCMFP
jgi:hypothetical protein